MRARAGPGPEQAAEVIRLARPGWLIAALFAIGFGSKLHGVVSEETLFTRFPSEDGYLMMTIARNLATGLGMTTAAGTLPTNGTQPLSMLLFSGAFALVGGDRFLGVQLILVLELLIASLTALALFLLGRRVLAGRAYADLAAALAAAVWYSSTLNLRFSMNCLETGLYALAVLVVARVTLSLDDRSSWRQMVGFGLLLGVVFWVRNDAIFLIAAVAAVTVGMGGPRTRSRILGRAARMGVACVAAFFVALPWLLYNWFEFGSIVPISGRAESLAADFGGNLSRIPVLLAQQLLAILEISTPGERSPLLGWLGALVVLLGVVFYARAWRSASGPERRLIVLVALFGALLCGNYGLLFSAPYALKRYLFPLSPFLALGTCAGLCHLLQDPGPRTRFAAVVFGGVLVGHLTLSNWNASRRGESDPHWEKVVWIQEHVSPDEWVGSLQSGVVGFFHDRTLNLDGKVNPQALQARRQGRIPGYVLRSDIEWLVDWPLILSLVTHPAIAEEFELKLRRRRLVVARRREAPS